MPVSKFLIVNRFLLNHLKMIFNSKNRLDLEIIEVDGEISTENYVNSKFTTTKSISANYTAEDRDYILVTTGSSDITITLPDISITTSPIIVEIKKVDSGVGDVIIDGNGSNINGESTKIITFQHTSVTLHGENGEWNIK